MPVSSKVDSLPKSVKKWLDGHLVEGNFSGYEALATELEGRGFEISKSSLHRYGKKFQVRLRKMKESTERAQVLREHLGDDEGAVTDSLIRQVQWMLEEIISELEPAQIETKDMSKLAKAIADLSRASVTTKKYMREVRHAASEAADAVEQVVSAAGVGPESIQLIRRQILGIPDKK